MSLTVSYGCWLSLIVSLSTMKLLNVSNCLLLLLSVSHCLYYPKELPHPSMSLIVDGRLSLSPWS